MWGNSSHHVGKQHPMSIIEGSKVHPFSTGTLPTIWWNSQSDLLQSGSSVRVNINKGMNNLRCCLRQLISFYSKEDSNSIQQLETQDGM